MSDLAAPKKLTRLRGEQGFRSRLDELGIRLPLQEAPADPAEDPLAQPLDTPCGRVGNRFAILPMEGWDATTAGAPSDLVRRRWRRFGESGAKLVWGGEAMAVRPDGRANPNQLVIDADAEKGLDALRRELAGAHQGAGFETGDLKVGLQLTHSGRWARPEGPPAPRTAQRHPVLDARQGIADDQALLTDSELDDLVDTFGRAAAVAGRAGFDFVDFKHCHGYLAHELLGARTRPGPYGGDFAGRTRFFTRTLDAIARDAPGLAVGVRLSVFDVAPYEPGEDGVGVPDPGGPEVAPFGGRADGLGLELDETHQLLALFAERGIGWVCTTAGSPYYNPHVQRPAFYPPSDGYRPPEDPLVGVARQIAATAELKARHPDLLFVGSAYTYLQEWLPAVGRGVLAEGGADWIGLGRMALSYPTLPADVLAGRPLERGLVCRTFSDCTTAPRNGLISGCYPLDPFYKRREEAERLAEIKKSQGL